MEIVQHPPKIATQEMMVGWASEWAKAGMTIDWEKLLSPEGEKHVGSSNIMVNDLNIDDRRKVLEKERNTLAERP